jgi:hypothetical protein
MPLTLGPENGTLTVRTGKGGAAAKAGHNLRMEVTKWSASLDLGEQPSLALSADPRSLRVVEASGGAIPLGDAERAAIPQTIDEEVLRGAPIEFRSTEVAVDGGRIDVHGQLALFGAERPVAFTLDLGADGHLEGNARVRQSDWGVKPYSALFGTLKVADEVEVAVDAMARSSDDG